MILSSDDTVRPIPRYKVIHLPRYGNSNYRLVYDATRGTLGYQIEIRHFV